jgi:hypothetical protein
VAISAHSIAQVDETITIPQFRTVVILSNRGPMTVSHAHEPRTRGGATGYGASACRNRRHRGKDAAVRTRGLVRALTAFTAAGGEPAAYLEDLDP